MMFEALQGRQSTKTDLYHVKWSSDSAEIFSLVFAFSGKRIGRHNRARFSCELNVRIQKTDRLRILFIPWKDKSWFTVCDDHTKC